MACEKHKQRKRQDCVDCFPLKPVFPVNEVKVETRKVLEPAKKGKITKEMAAEAIAKVKANTEEANQKKLETRVETRISNTLYKPLIPLTSNEDVDREVRIEVSKIREYIDTMFAQALEKVKNEINAVKTLRWEHMHIPLPVYNIALMNVMALDGWKFCDMIRNPKQYGYAEEFDIVIVQRIIKPDNKPTPDLSKPSNARKYVEKSNGIK